jgi:hypothetical protein
MGVFVAAALNELRDYMVEVDFLKAGYVAHGAYPGLPTPVTYVWFNLY